MARGGLGTPEAPAHAPPERHCSQTLLHGTLSGGQMSSHRLRRGDAGTGPRWKQTSQRGHCQLQLLHQRAPQPRARGWEGPGFLRGGHEQEAASEQKMILKLQRTLPSLEISATLKKVGESGRDAVKRVQARRRRVWGGRSSDYGEKEILARLHPDTRTDSQNRPHRLVCAPLECEGRVARPKGHGHVSREDVDGDGSDPG